LFSVRLEFSVRKFPRFKNVGSSWRASICFPEVSWTKTSFLLRKL
jgi:hypothetical protein